MGVFDVIRGRKDSHIVEDLGYSESHEPKNLGDGPETPPTESDSRLSLEERNERNIQLHPDEVTKEAHLGVQKAEASAIVWTKPALFGTYAWIWVCFFMLAFHSSINSNVINKAYSSFSSAPQISTSNILYSIIGGVLKLPIAKTINIWGRAEGYLVFIGVYVLGLIILAACNNPDSYAAGYVLYWIGYDAIYLILQIFVADTSGLRNRAFAFAFASTPFICTAFVGPRAAESLMNMTSWRWAYGAFAIIQPFVFAPLAFVFKYYEKKAERMGLYKREPSGRTLSQSIVHYIHEFDIVGACLLMAAWVLLLLPFSLQQYGRSTYSSPTFIAMVVIGFCLMFVFAAWEKWGARVHFVQYELLKKRTVVGACCLSAVTYFSFYCWDMYYYNFCLVVYDLSITLAGYMGQIYNVGSCFWGVVFGLWVRYTKTFKNTCLFFGLPLLILGAGLMIHFRGQGDHGDIGYVIMSQIFIAFGGGTLVIGADMAVMASADREGVPMMLALLGLFNSLGGSVGYAVAAAIYANTFPDALLSNLPESTKSKFNDLYTTGYTEQMKYPPGDPTREAANLAWSTSQYYGAIAATAFLGLAIPCIAVWKNYRVDKKQNKGVVI